VHIVLHAQLLERARDLLAVGRAGCVPIVTYKTRVSISSLDFSFALDGVGGCEGMGMGRPKGQKRKVRNILGMGTGMGNVQIDVG